MKANIEKLKKLISPIAEKHGLDAVYFWVHRSAVTQVRIVTFYVKRGEMRGLFQLSAPFIDLKAALNKDVDIVLKPVQKEN